MDLLTALKDRDPTDAATCVGWLVLLAGDVDLDPGLEPHLVRFMSLAGLTAAQTPEQRQAAVEQWFAQHAVAPDLLALFQASVDAVQAGTAAATNDGGRAAAALLGSVASSTPVGHGERPAGTLRGGLAGLVQARSKRP